MLTSGQQSATPPQTRVISKRNTYFKYLLIGMILLETLLVTMALIPAQIWSRLLPQITTASQNGPFPPAIAPIIVALMYLTPTFIGVVSRTWQQALLFATLPAWLGLGIFLTLATTQFGAFSLVATDNVVSHVAVLELFLALGGIGWLLKYVVLKKRDATE